MLYQGNRTTIARTKYARKLGSANTDMVMSFVPIPPGSLIQGIGYNYTTVAKDSLPIEQAMETTLHGFVWTSPYPYHGYGTGINGVDNLWDDVVPKDKEVEYTLEDLPQDVVAAFSAVTADVQMDGGAIESGANGDPETQWIANTLDRGPRCIFARVTRHDISNSIVADTDKMRCFDHASGLISDNFYVPRDKYAYVMFGVGAPQFEVTHDKQEYQPTDDVQWNELAFPELENLQVMMGKLGEQSPDGSNRYQKHLENAEIESDTYEDNSGSQVEDWRSFLDLSVRYQRPRFPQIPSGSRLTRD